MAGRGLGTEDLQGVKCRHTTEYRDLTAGLNPIPSFPKADFGIGADAALAPNRALGGPPLLAQYVPHSIRNRLDGERILKPVDRSEALFLSFLQKAYSTNTGQSVDGLQERDRNGPIHAAPRPVAQANQERMRDPSRKV